MVLPSALRAAVVIAVGLSLGPLARAQTPHSVSSYQEGTEISHADAVALSETPECEWSLVANRIVAISLEEYEARRGELRDAGLADPHDPLSLEREFSSAFLRSVVLVGCSDDSWALVQGDGVHDPAGAEARLSTVFRVLTSGSAGNWARRPTNDTSLEILFSGIRSTDQTMFVIVRVTYPDNNRWMAGRLGEQGFHQDFGGVDLRTGLELDDATPNSPVN